MRSEIAKRIMNETGELVRMDVRECGDFIANGGKIVEASEDETANEIIKRCGVETVKEGDVTYWIKDSKKVTRPKVDRWELKMEEYFNIRIVYVAP
jgi:hypothetical protein